MTKHHTHELRKLMREENTLARVIQTTPSFTERERDTRKYERVQNKILQLVRKITGKEVTSHA